MKILRLVLISMFLTMLGHSIQGQAEDIDLYSGVGSTGDLPNVLFVMDNAANWNANSSSSCTYYDGTSPSLGATTGGIEQCALVNAIHALLVNNDGSAVVNIGIMAYNKNGFEALPTDGGYSCQSGGRGGCLMYALQPMDAAHKNSIIATIKAWTNPAVQSNNEATSQAMQESWAYYAGRTGMSGRTYTSPLLPDGCAKNYVVFIGNALNNSGTPGDASASPGAQLNSTVDANNDLTSQQKTQLKASILTSGTYGIKNVFSCSPNPFTIRTQDHSETSGLYADEWARYMSSVDLGTPHVMPATKKIITYTIGVLSSDCKSEYPALMTNMANVGGGKYFPTSNAVDLQQAILQVLNEVQAVNSVFSSSSLPVAINTQGFFSNQVYMGMFRPDATGVPRWKGNLKKYQFALNTTDPNNTLLFLADATGSPAITGSGSGFLSPNAASLWTCTNSSRAATLVGPAGATTPYSALPTCADPALGFWANMPNGVGYAWDLPDGEYVEKGGAAQMLRLANLTDDYTVTPNTTTNPRKLYTCTGSCASGSALSGYLFYSGNTDVAANLGIVPTRTIDTLTRSGVTATAHTTTAHGMTNGVTAQISGAAQSEYNGAFVMTVTGASTFTYTVGIHPVSPATGTITASVPSSVPVEITSLTRSGSTVTVTAPGNTLVPGGSATISGVTPAAYNGTWTVSCGGTCNPTFTYTGPAEGPVTPAGGGTATVSGVTRTIAAVNANPNPGLVRAGTTVTVTTTANHGFANTGTVTIAGASDSGYDGNWSYTKTGNKSFTYSLPSTTPTTPATVTGATVSGTGATSIGIDSLTRILGAGDTATVTATTSSNLTGMVVGNTYSISISGATQTQYNGTFTATIVDLHTFTYGITTAPATPATGSIVLGSPLTATDLINWVRGEDNFGDEASICPPGATAGTGNCPNTNPTVNIRPSVHGDVLHSRPVVIDYGGTTGVVAFYGDNGGVFHAVSGATGSEMWGFIPTEFFGKLKRQHDNSPAMLLPSTPPGIVPAPQTKDYFFDGPTGVYQRLNSLGGTETAYLYLTMRRGGRTIYALDVTDPTDPKFKWKHSGGESGFEKLGQTWSLPKVAVVNGYTDHPVLIFGAGYDATHEDTEPPGTDTMGQGIFILDAVTGAIIWKATPDSTVCRVRGNPALVNCGDVGMNYSIPSDITLLDRNNDGKIDRLYVGDLGGNVWRVDLEPTSDHITPDFWQAEKLAALGCDGGACASGTTPRKIFYPPEVIAGVPSSPSYDAVFVTTGDREHPLYSTATQSACAVTNRAYFLKDTAIGSDGSGLSTIIQSPLCPANAGTCLFDVTSSFTNDTTGRGYYINFGSCEKGVNAPLVVAGTIFFGTSQTAARGTNQCTATLGTARSYQISPFIAKFQCAGDPIVCSLNYTAELFPADIGMPPSPVAGVVTIGGKQYPFCIGCEASSPLAATKPLISPSTARSRSYWFIRGR